MDDISCAWADHYLWAVICRSRDEFSANEKEETFASNNKVGYIGGGSFTIWLQKRFLWYSSRDSVRKARESHFIDKAMTLEPNDLKAVRIIVIYIFISLSFRFYVIRHFRLSLLNIF